MRLKTIEVYDYNDVINNETLKTKVLENLHDINVNYDWWTWIVDDWKERLESLGFENSEIEFDLYSQRAHACFHSNWLDINKLIANSKLTEKEKKIMTWLIDHNYLEGYKIPNDPYSHLVEYENWIDSKYQLINNIVIKFENEIENLYYELCDQIYNDLRREFEYLTSEEGILETIQANEYKFDENGEIA